MSKFFIGRPIVAIVIAIVMTLVGLIALSRLPIAQYPEIVPPMVQVTGTYTGADAVAVEQTVATPIEQQVNGVENSIYMKSINANDGSMTLQVTFNVGTNLDMANVLTQNRVSQATPTLPEDVKKYGVSVKKSLAFPLMLVALTSPNASYDSKFLSNYASINIIDQLARIQGIGQVNQFGGADYAMRVWVDPNRLAKLGLTVPDLANAIQQQNLLAPSGQIGGPPAVLGQQFTYAVRTRGRLMTPEEFGEVIVRSNPDGSQVRLRDIARIELGSQNYSSIGRLDGKSSVIVVLYQIPGSNALAVADQVKKTMAELSQRFPPDMKYTVALDTTLPITAGIEEIEHTLLEAILLVILVVFLFLQNWRATLIPLLAVPVSLVATFAAFPLLGFSINVLSLLGLVLAIGIVVDDAIVVVEAVMHHIEHGLSPRDATLKAMEEVSGPVIGIGLILASVFIPVGFMGGITGRLYQQFAITIGISVLFSAFNALTLSPALAAMMLKPATPAKGPVGKAMAWFFGKFNQVFDWTTGGYLGIAGMFARKMARGLILMAVVVGGIVLLGRFIPGGFVPEEDQGFFLANVQLPDASSIQRTDAADRTVEQILGAAPGVQSVTTVTGYSMLTQAYASNTGFFFVQLKPWHDRHHAHEHAFALIEDLNKTLAANVPQALAFAFGPPAIPGLGTGAGFTIMLQDRGGHDPEYLAKQTELFLAAVRQRKEIGRASSVYRSSVPQVYADIDRDKVLKLGTQLKDVQQTLGSFLGGTYLNDFNRFGRTYKVYLQAEPQFRSKTEDINAFYVRGADGNMVSLGTLVRTEPTSGPEFTNRFNLYRASMITGVPAPGYSSAQSLTALEEVAKQVLPPDVGYAWTDMSYQEKEAEGTGNTTLILSVVFVFLILAAMYESWTLPFSVLLGTPFAVIGAFLGLFIGRYVNNVFAQIGLLTLVGLAAKNAILIVEFARMLQHQGKPIMEAALEAAKLRFRPILMTAFAFILGVLPLVRASGAGAEGRKVIGTAVFSGMLVATILGVFLVPMLFVLVERLAGAERPKKGAPPAAKAAHETPDTGGH
jgi:hydrophobic/amphiphilic exporter-1 (mainly G- bacteria), HAE1 family